MGRVHVRLASAGGNRPKRETDGDTSPAPVIALNIGARRIFNIPRSPCHVIRGVIRTCT